MGKKKKKDKMWVSPLINHSQVPDLCNGLSKRKLRTRYFCVCLKNPFEMFMVMDSHLKGKKKHQKAMTDRGGRYGQYLLSRCVQSYIGVNVYNLNTVIV